MGGFDIGTRHVGDGSPCFIMAEVGLAHDGSLGNAHAFIDAVFEAGVDAVKFQCHLGDQNDQWRVEQEWPQDMSRQEFWRRTGFRDSEWASLKRHADYAGVEFLCSPFSVEAVEMLDPLVPAWKVPSGLVGRMSFYDAIADTEKPVILSHGMRTTALTREGWAHLLCTSMYPCPPEKIGLGALASYDGLSDHSGTIWPSIAAATLGASIVEVHVCWSKQQYGFDTSSSITIEELAQMVEGIRFIEKAKQPVDKDKLAEELAPMREMFMGVS